MFKNNFFRHLILLCSILLCLVSSLVFKTETKAEEFTQTQDDIVAQIKTFCCHSTDRILLHGAKWYFTDKAFKRLSLIKNTEVTAPTYFKIGDWANGQINMTWQTVPDVDGFYIYGYDSPKKEYSIVATLPASATSYSLAVAQEDLCTKYRLRTFKKVYGSVRCSDASITCGVATKSTFSKNDTYFIGHRGVMEQAPEDTICSFDLAYSYGYPAIEADFYVTNSGDLIISHADNLLEGCGVNLSVLDVTASTISKYPIIHGNNVDKYEPQYLLTMEQFISHMADLDIAFYMHIKTPSMSKEKLQEIYDLLDQYGQLDNGHIFTSNEECLKNLALFDWNYGFLKIPLYYADYKEALNIGIENKCEFMIYQYNESFPSSIIKEGNAHGIRIGFYDTTTPESISREINNGVNFLIINDKYFSD